MKKLALLTLLFAAAMQAMAGDYDYLVVEKTNGTRTALQSSGLVITFKNGTFYSTRNGLHSTFQLTDLSKMYFSATSTAIKNHTDADSQLTVYSLDGIRLGTFSNSSAWQSSLPKGIYIVKSNGKTYKQTIK